MFISITYNHSIPLTQTTTPIITLEEGGDPAVYTFHSTIPFMAPVGFEDQLLHIDVVVPKVQAGPGVCANTEALVQFDITQCGVKVKRT